jgi:hypothetical protein
MSDKKNQQLVEKIQTGSTYGRFGVRSEVIEPQRHLSLDEVSDYPLEKLRTGSTYGKTRQER